MVQSPRKSGQCASGAGSRPAWGWLAAAAGGLLAGRSQGRFGVVMGVGLAAWAIWRTRPLGEVTHADDAAADSPRRTFAKEDPAEKKEQQAVNGALSASAMSVWLLDLEPMPSVVADEGEATAPPVMGLGEDWLGQGPLLTTEEYEEAPSLLPQSEEAWLNGGAEIPDSVELPEV